MPNTNPPAVVGGVPTVARRFFFRWVCTIHLATLLALALIPAAWLTGLTLRPGRMILAAPLIFAALTILMVARLRRLRRRLRDNPLACLHCAYPTVHPRTGVCPECAHRSDRADLDQHWTRALAPA